MLPKPSADCELGGALNSVGPFTLPRPSWQPQHRVNRVVVLLQSKIPARTTSYIDDICNDQKLQSNNADARGNRGGGIPNRLE